MLPLPAHVGFSPVHFSSAVSELVTSVLWTRALALAGSAEVGKSFHLKSRGPASVIYPRYRNHRAPCRDAKAWLPHACGGFGGWEIYIHQHRRSVLDQGKCVLVSSERGQITSIHVWLCTALGRGLSAQFYCSHLFSLSSLKFFLAFFSPPLFFLSLCFFFFFFSQALLTFAFSLCAMREVVQVAQRIIILAETWGGNSSCQTNNGCR